MQADPDINVNNNKKKMLSSVGNLGNFLNLFFSKIKVYLMFWIKNRRVKDGFVYK